jgi:hypothetical protein
VQTARPQRSQNFRTFLSLFLGQILQRLWPDFGFSAVAVVSSLTRFSLSATVEMASVMFLRRFIRIWRRRRISGFTSSSPNSTRNWRRRDHLDSFLQSGTLQIHRIKLASADTSTTLKKQDHWPAIYLPFTRIQRQHVIHVIHTWLGIVIMKDDVRFFSFLHQYVYHDA